MRLLIDECLHMSLVAIAEKHGHHAIHVNWLGLIGKSDWKLMQRIIQDDLTFVTNNAKDFRRLYLGRTLHAGLIIIIPQLNIANQIKVFDFIMGSLVSDEMLINEVIEAYIHKEEIVLKRYDLPMSD